MTTPTVDRALTADRLTSYVSTLYVHADAADLLDVDTPESGTYTTLGIDGTVLLFFPDPIALAARLRLLADELETANDPHVSREAAVRPRAASNTCASTESADVARIDAHRATESVAR